MKRMRDGVVLFFFFQIFNVLVVSGAAAPEVCVSEFQEVTMLEECKEAAMPKVLLVHAITGKMPKIKSPTDCPEDFPNKIFCKYQDPKRKAALIEGIRQQQKKAATSVAPQQEDK